MVAITIILAFVHQAGFEWVIGGGLGFLFSI